MPSESVLSRTVLIAIVALLVGYGIGFFGGLVLVSRLSSNTHDRSVEAAMTAAFVTGPIAAVVSLVLALVVLYSRARQ